MTNEAQRIAIAQACGWKGPYKNEWLKEWGKEGEDHWAFCGTVLATGEREPLPDYLSDLNAMHEAEKALTTSALCDEYNIRLEAMMDTSNPGGWKWHATAAQRAEALLRTLSLWDDSK